MADYYYCEHKHVVWQIKSEESNPKCPGCQYIMTFGRYTSKKEEGMLLKCSVSGCSNIGITHHQRGNHGILLCERHSNSA